jgi:hypothetical protein
MHADVNERVVVETRTAPWLATADGEAACKPPGERGVRAAGPCAGLLGQVLPFAAKGKTCPSELFAL